MKHEHDTSIFFSALTQQDLLRYIHETLSRLDRLGDRIEAYVKSDQEYSDLNKDSK